MGSVPGYDIIVLRNGEDVSNKVVAGRTRLEKGKLSCSWEIEFAEPMNLSVSDRWTIKRRVAGYESEWCQDAVARTLGGEDSVDSASKQNLISLRSDRRVAGDASRADVNELLTYCIPKMLVFVNQDWLLDMIPTAKLVDSILVYGGVGPGGLDASRIYHPRLPGPEFESNSFQCILGIQTHHDIAKYLARLVGYQLVTNTPNVEIIDTYTVASGTTWLSAIENVFKTLWFSTTEVRGTTIYISDMLSEGYVIAAVQKIVLTDDAIQSASLNQATQQKKEQPVDHVIITGRRTNDTTVLQPEEPDYTLMELPEISVQAMLTIEVSRDFINKDKYKQMAEYTGAFGLPGEEVTPKKLHSQTHDMHYCIEEKGDRRRYIQVKETIKTYDKDNTLVAKKEIEYKYAKGFIPTRTIEKEYVYCNLPGQQQKDLHLLSTKTTIQRHCRKPINLTLTEELFEGKVLYELVEIGGQQYKTDPIVMIDALRSDTTRQIVDTDPNTKQQTLDMTLSQRSTSIFRTDDEILVKHEQTYDVLTGHTRSNSQVLENPQRDRNKKKKDHVFRKEYFDGPGKMIGGYGPCYHPPKTIHHDDISTEALADKVAARAFARKHIDMNHEWSIKIPFPVPIESLATIVTLPEFQARVNGQLVAVPGGDFVLKSVSENFSFDGDGNRVNMNVETTLVVRAKY